MPFKAWCYLLYVHIMLFNTPKELAMTQLDMLLLQHMDQPSVVTGLRDHAAMAGTVLVYVYKI